MRFSPVVNKIDKKYLKIFHCPTEKIVADYSSKTTHGSVFEVRRRNQNGRFRDV